MSYVRRLRFLPLSIALVAASTYAHADGEARDPARARALLLQGYELAQAGKCAEAIPLFKQSLDLDANVKILLNLARCEESTAKLLDALAHWTAARALASEQGQTAVVTEADARRAALERRVPKLSVDLAAGFPRDVRVAVDGADVPLDALARGVQRDVGPHTIVVTANGRVDETMTVDLGPGDSKTVVTRVGLPIPGPGASAPAAVPSAPAPSRSESPPNPSASAWSPWKTAGLVTAGVGLAGLGVGSYFGLDAISKNSRSNAGCTGNSCTQDAAVLRNDARSSGDTATAFVITGASLAVIGAVVFFVAPRARAPDVARAVLLPTLRSGGAGLVLQGEL